MRYGSKFKHFGAVSWLLDSAAVQLQRSWNFKHTKIMLIAYKRKTRPDAKGQGLKQLLLFTAIALFWYRTLHP